MPIDPKLVGKAYRAPQDLRFDEAVLLATQLGFEEVRQVGSHKIFRHPGAAVVREEFPRPLNLQRGQNGKAKKYQVEEMLQMAEALGIIPPRE